MMESNFSFLLNNHPRWYSDATFAEDHVQDTPDISMIAVRRLLEIVLEDVAKNQLDLREYSEYGNLDLIDQVKRVSQWSGWAEHYDDMDLIRRAGNAAVHGVKKLQSNSPSSIGSGGFDALKVLKALFHVLCWVAEERSWLSNLPEFMTPPIKPKPSEAELAKLVKNSQELEDLRAERKKHEKTTRQLRSIWQHGSMGLLGQRRTVTQVEEFTKAHRSALHEGAFEEPKRKMRNDPVTDVAVVQTELDEIHPNALEELARTKDLDGEKRDEFERRERELQKMEYRVREEMEWQPAYPKDDWTKIPSFFRDRLERGVPPFRPWLGRPIEIGRGNFGVVYKCYPKGGGIPVAVKIPREVHGGAGAMDLEKNWKGEIKIAKQLAYELDQNDFRGIAKPLEFAPPSFPGFVEYELVGGENLEKQLKKQPKKAINIVLATHITAELAFSIASLAQAGIQFTDLAARNVMIGKDNQPSLIDPAPCFPGTVLTPPEWNSKSRGVRLRSDLFASGVSYLLGHLFLKMIGDHKETFGGGQVLSNSFERANLESQASPEPQASDLEKEAAEIARVHGQITKAYEGLDRARHCLDYGKLAALIGACVIKDNSERKEFRLEELGKQLRLYYDPAGLIDAISRGV